MYPRTQRVFVHFEIFFPIRIRLFSLHPFFFCRQYLISLCLTPVSPVVFLLSPRFSLH